MDKACSVTFVACTGQYNYFKLQAGGVFIRWMRCTVISVTFVGCTTTPNFKLKDQIRWIRCSDAAADGAGGGEAAGCCSSNNSDLIELHLKWLLMQPAKQG